MCIDSAVCIILRSQTWRCASHRQVRNFPILCFDPKFYKCYFSVIPEDINIKIKRCVKYERMKNGHFRISLTPQCASHDVHHIAKSNCTPQSQNQNLCESLAAFKGTIRSNPFRGERKDLKKNFSIC